MITFNNRYAEFDNLDDSKNENVLKNCYFKEFSKNSLGYIKNIKRNQNIRYSNQNYNDIRLNNIRSNSQNNIFSSFPKLPFNNNNHNIFNKYNSIQFNNNNNEYNNINQRFKLKVNKSVPNYNKLVGFNHLNNYIQNANLSTPTRYRYNNNNNNFNNFNNIENSFNNSNDSIQFFNESENLYNNYNYNNMDISNEYSYEQEFEQNNENEMIENEIRKEKQKQLLLEQERLNQIEKELKELRLKRNLDLKKLLAQKQKENNKWLKKNIYSYRIRNRNMNMNKTRKNYNQSFLLESLKSGIIKDRLYMKQLIDDVNRLKLSQKEANIRFREKIDDLFDQNELIKSYNNSLINKIKEMKYVLKEREYKNDIINDYLIEKINKKNNKYINSFRAGNPVRKSNSFFLGKKDKDINDFNLLNKSIINENKKSIVTPLLYDNYKNQKIKMKNISRNENIKDDDLYYLIRQSKDRLDDLKELEDKLDSGYDYN